MGKSNYADDDGKQADGSRRAIQRKAQLNWLPLDEGEVHATATKSEGYPSSGKNNVYTEAYGSIRYQAYKLIYFPFKEHDGQNKESFFLGAGSPPPGIPGTAY